MKHFLLALILICGPFGCTPGFSFSKKPPTVETPAPTPTPSPSPVVVDAAKGRQLLADLATKDVCASAEYGDPSKKNPKILKDQGRAPAGYMKGLVLTYVILTSDDWQKQRFSIQKNCQMAQCKQLIGAFDELFLTIDKALQKMPTK